MQVGVGAQEKRQQHEGVAGGSQYTREVAFKPALRAYQLPQSRLPSPQHGCPSKVVGRGKWEPVLAGSWLPPAPLRVNM